MAALQRHIFQSQTEEYCQGRRRCPRCAAQLLFSLGEPPMVETVRQRTLRVGARLEGQGAAPPNSMPAVGANAVTLSIDATTKAASPVVAWAAGKVADVLCGLETYVAGLADLIIDYAMARRCEEPISTRPPNGRPNVRSVEPRDPPGSGQSLSLSRNTARTGASPQLSRLRSHGRVIVWAHPTVSRVRMQHGRPANHARYHACRSRRRVAATHVRRPGTRYLRCRPQSVDRACRRGARSLGRDADQHRRCPGGRNTLPTVTVARLRAIPGHRCKQRPGSDHLVSRTGALLQDVREVHHHSLAGG